MDFICAALQPSKNPHGLEHGFGVGQPGVQSGINLGKSLYLSDLSFPICEMEIIIIIIVPTYNIDFL